MCMNQVKLCCSNRQPQYLSGLTTKVISCSYKYPGSCIHLAIQPASRTACFSILTLLAQPIAFKFFTKGKRMLEKLTEIFADSVLITCHMILQTARWLNFVIFCMPWKDMITAYWQVAVYRSVLPMCNNFENKWYMLSVLLFCFFFLE